MQNPDDNTYPYIDLGTLDYYIRSVVRLGGRDDEIRQRFDELAERARALQKEVRALWRVVDQERARLQAEREARRG
jgi:hypothetical protein